MKQFVKRMLFISAVSIYLLNTGVLAQITISVDEYPTGIGTTFFQYNIWDDSQTGIPCDVGESGGPHTWDFNSTIYPGGSVFTVDIVTPEGTPFIEQFPDADHVWYFNTENTESYFYYNLTESELLFLGFGFDSSGNTGYIERIPPQKAFVFPGTLGSEWETISADSFWVSDAAYFKNEMIINSYIDAWGTIQIPAGSYNCLRIREQVLTIATMVVSGIPVMADTSSEFSYAWVTENEQVLASITSLDGEENPDFTLASDISFKVNDPAAIDDHSNHLISTVKLFDNFPNPFNPGTVIRYQLPAAGEVDLSIYNLTGQKVATLVSAIQPADIYQVTWDGSNFASGIYFYRLKTGNTVQTKRMILIR